MTDNRTAAPAAPPLRGKGALLTGAVLLVIGAVAIIVGIVLTANAASSVLDNNKIGSAQTAPATFTNQLDGGTTYAVYEATQGVNGTTAVQPADISVTGPSGPVTISKTSGTVNTTGADNKTYAEVATFDPPTTGSYTIAVATKGSVVAVAPALSTAAKGVAWIVAVVLGGFVALIGLILIIIGAVRRSSSRNTQQDAFGGAAAGNPSN